jgi:hypothetical protein
MPGQKIARRIFLGSSLACVVSLGVSQGIKNLDRGDRDEIKIGKRLSGLFAKEDSALRVGSEFLRNQPQEVNLDGIVRRLFPSRECRRSYCQASDSEFREYLADRRARDFDNHLTVSVDGWVLAESEALTCAAVFLVSLS